MQEFPDHRRTPPQHQTSSKKPEQNFSMNLDLVRDLESALSIQSREISQILFQLSTQLDVLRPQWSGDAAEAYRAAQLEWNKSMDRMAKLLFSASRVSGNAVDLHLEARAKVVKLWR